MKVLAKSRNLSRCPTSPIRFWEVDLISEWFMKYLAQWWSVQSIDLGCTSAEDYSLANLHRSQRSSDPCHTIIRACLIARRPQIPQEKSLTPCSLPIVGDLHLVQILTFDHFTDSNPTPHIGDFHTSTKFSVICVWKRTCPKGTKLPVKIIHQNITNLLCQ